VRKYATIYLNDIHFSLKVESPAKQRYAFLATKSISDMPI